MAASIWPSRLSSTLSTTLNPERHSMRKMSSSILVLFHEISWVLSFILFLKYVRNGHVLPVFLVVPVTAFDQEEKLQQTYVTGKNNSDKAIVMTTLFSRCSCNGFVQNLGQGAFQALNWAYWTPEPCWLHSLMARSLPSDFLNTHSNQRKSFYGNSATIDISLIVELIWKTKKLYILDLAFGNVNVPSWILPLDLMNYITFPFSKQWDAARNALKICCGMKTSQTVCWVCSVVSIYCDCCRTRKFIQTWSGRLTCNSYRVTYSTVPLFFNLRDIASELAPMRQVFQTTQTLLGKEGNQWLIYLGSCFFFQKPWLWLSPGGAMLRL